MRILLIGGGDLTQQLAHYIKLYDALVQVAGFVDDFAKKGAKKYGLVCLGRIDEVLDLYSSQKFDSVIIGIGYSHFKIRQQIFNDLSGKIPFYTFVHPTAFVDNSAVVNEGCCIGPNVIIEQRVIIESNVFVYGGVNISHDSKLGAHSFIAPSVAVAGFVEIGSRCFIGLHASVVERVNIAHDVIVGAGALVLTNLSEPGIYIGAPACKK